VALLAGQIRIRIRGLINYIETADNYSAIDYQGTIFLNQISKDAVVKGHIYVCSSLIVGVGHIIGVWKNNHLILRSFGFLHPKVVQSEASTTRRF
jgi:hypothetical protein